MKRETCVKGVIASCVLILLIVYVITQILAPLYKQAEENKVFCESKGMKYIKSTNGQLECGKIAGEELKIHKYYDKHYFER